MTIALNEATLLVLLALEYVACCLQVIHLALCVASAQRPRHTRLAYELGALVHLLLAACFTLREGPRGAFLHLQVLASPWSAFLWANAAAVLLALKRALQRRSPLKLAEAALMALCVPPAIEALGGAWLVVAFADVSLFLARGVRALSADRLRRGQSPTRLSVGETINTVPTGLLATDGHGRSLVMNNAMRTLLERLGCPTDLGDLGNLWELLAAHACPPQPGDQGSDARAGAGDDQLVVPDTFGGVVRVTRTRASGGRTFYLAEGITEQYLANQRLGKANAQLAEAAESLRARLADVGAIAEGEAYLRMRQRVHDVVGQRLSILHRYLEEGRLDEGSVTELTALLTSIPLDLRGQGADASASLEAVVEAFALVDVTVRVTGELPNNADVAAAFARTVREAATNACRHGHAHTVSVALGSRTDGQQGHRAVLLVTDDGSGMPEGSAIGGGSGIAGMRRALSSVGGVLAITSTQPFTLYAEAPDPTPGPAMNSHEEAS